MAGLHVDGRTVPGEGNTCGMFFDELKEGYLVKTRGELKI